MSARTLLALLAVLVALAVSVSLLLTADDEEDAALTGARTPADRRDSALEDPLERAAPEPGTVRQSAEPGDSGEDPAPPPVAQTPQVLHGLRVTGLALEINGDLPITEARVQVSYFFGDRRDRIALGSTVTDDAGRYVFALDQLELLSPASLVDAIVYCQLTEPGYAPEWSYAELREREGNAVTVDLNTSRGEALVHGRVLDQDGEPIHRATVVLRSERGFSRASTLSARSGAFFVERETDHPYCAVHVSHESYGQAKRVLEVASDALEVDLGDIVLEPRGILAGRVVGFDGSPLARVRVSALPLEEDGPEHDAVEVFSGPGGGFRFANLAPLPHWLDAGIGTESGPVVTPDHDGIELRVQHASARVTMRDAAGALVPGVDLWVNRLELRDGRWKQAAREAVDEETTFDGVHHLLFAEVGTYALIAELEDRSGQIWSARRRVTIERRHHEFDLQLKQETRVPLDISVTRPDGTSLASWTVRVVAPEADVRLASMSSDESGCEVIPGEWRFEVVPRAPEHYLRFETVVHIAADRTEPVHLVAHELGGRLVLHGRANAPARTLPHARYELRGPLPAQTLAHRTGKLSAGKDVPLYHAVPAGRYLVRGVSDAGPVTEGEVTLRSGETTRFELDYPVPLR